MNHSASDGGRDPALRARAQRLGWLSIALGAGPLLSPRVTARLAGVEEQPRNLALLRAVGARELLVAAGLLRQPAPIWVWARVGQDAMDLPLGFVSVMGKRGSQRARAQATLATLLAITAVDVYAAVRSRRSPTAPAGRGETAPGTTKETPMKAQAAVTISRSQQEVSSRWNEVEPPASGENVLVSYAPAPGGRGTEVRVVLEKEVTGGAIGEKVAAIAGKDPQRQLEDALRRFKQVLETGEVVRSDGSPGGTDATQQRKQREAQPLGTGN